MKLVVGLGNPGEKYENSRHNVGFMMVDRIMQNLKCKMKNYNLKFKTSKKFQAKISQITNHKSQILLVKPQTFMNESGVAVKKIITNHKSQITNLYVVHDDLDIPLGEYKIQFGKGPKNHNGVLSVEKELGTKDFWRVRIGIENRALEDKSFRVLGEDYVLQKFTKEEREILDRVIEKVIRKLLFTVIQ